VAVEQHTTGNQEKEAILYLVLSLQPVEGGVLTLTLGATALLAVVQAVTADLVVVEISQCHMVMEILRQLRHRKETVVVLLTAMEAQAVAVQEL